MRISVNADNREYSVQIGPGMIKEEGLFTGFRRAAVVTDETVAKLHLDTIMATLERAKVRAGSIILPPGEEIKSRDRLFDIYSGLMDNLIGRSDAVIAFGGGTVGDAAGFAAATYRRGVPLVHCPTTLLAQADSSIGGKVAIDHPRGKNLIGTFYQPVLVVTDTALLSTLPREHLASGMAEVIKCGAISSGDLNSGEDDLTRTVYRTAMIKAGYVQADTKDTGIRRELNFGHTIGHGIEAVKGIKGRRTTGLFHGECVALGMLPMIESKALQKRVRGVYRRLGLPTRTAYDKEKVLAEMLHDKKAQDGQITIIKVPGLGCWRAETIPVEGLRPLLGMED